MFMDAPHEGGYMDAEIADKWIAEMMDEIEVEAMNTITEYEEFRDRMNKSLEVKERSRLNVRVRRRGVVSLLLTWRRTDFYKKDGN